MRLKLDLTRATLTALFQPDDGGGYFPGPVIAVSSSSGREIPGLVTGFNWRRNAKDGSVVYNFSEPILFFGAGRSKEARKCFLDLSIPWVHERVASTCLSLLGVKNARAASMTRSRTGTVYTLRWVDGDDGLPHTTSWDRLGGAPVIGLYQNDLVTSYRLKLGDVPRIDLKPDATHDEALGALLLALDGRGERS